MEKQLLINITLTETDVIAIYKILGHIKTSEMAGTFGLNTDQLQIISQFIDALTFHL